MTPIEEAPDQDDKSSKESSQDKRGADALEQELTKPHPANFDEALAGDEEDGGESVLVGAPREGEAEHVDIASQKHSPDKHSPDKDSPNRDSPNRGGTSST